MSSTSPNFVGNASALDANSALSLTGLSRIVEIAYVSPPVQLFIGNSVAAAQQSMSLGTGSRIVEVGYVSQLGN